SKHIYMILKNDRNGMYSAVLKAFGIDKKAAIQNNDSKDSTFNVTDLNNSSTSESSKSFTLIISEEKWAQIKPKRQKCGRNKRKYMSLQSGKWTHIFADKIWQQTKLPCAFMFKRAKVYIKSDAKCYARFKGMCNECDAHLIGLLYNKPIKGNDAIFECTLTRFSTEVVHKKKRQLKRFLREKVANELVDGHKSASVWRNEEAKQLMTFGDNIPPILYDATVLRKAKQEEIDNKRLQLHNTDPLYNLHIAKCTRFVRTIHNIGLNPFYCMYWSLEQQIMYKKAHKQDDNCLLTVDATGSIGKKLRLPNGEKSPHLFLYECVCVSELGNFPAFQMISAKQDASMISYFLSEIIRDGAPIPKIVVTDFGKAILIAIAHIFANCIDLRHYLQICYNIINNICCNNIPQCYMRLDISHFIGMIAKWECLRGKAPKIRQFFLRCLGQAYQMENFTVVHNFLKSVLIVTLSEEIGLDKSGAFLSSEIHLRDVNNVIKGTVIDDIEKDDDCDDIENEDYDEINDDEEILASDWTTLAENLFLDAQEITRNSRNGSIVNAYYNPEAARKIKFLITYLPLWTGIMRSYFKRGSQIASSSFVEAEFSALKTRVFKNQLPMRIDKFIIRHLEYLE
ncbi:120.7 kDa protein in NOF-FB transposable element, partial [Camponotus floridanus]